MSLTNDADNDSEKKVGQEWHTHGYACGKEKTNRKRRRPRL